MISWEDINTVHDREAYLGSVAGPSEGTEPAYRFGSVNEFLRDYLRFTYRRRIDGQHRCWAARWWEYDEAVVRLDALWRSWEYLTQDETTGLSVWLRDHADHHMAVLMDPDGPFATATGEADKCRRGDPLPYLSPPDGLFPDVRHNRGSGM